VSTPFHLEVPRCLYEEMVAQAVTELPNECCGILAGTVIETGPEPGRRVGRVVKRYPLTNDEEKEPRRRFNAESDCLFAAHKDMRQLGLETLALYHSHPTSAPIPSATDLERNFWPQTVSLIISLTGPKPEVRGWWLGEKDYREAEWTCVEEEPAGPP
jgi:[CysO sulfur-carrier protein]-S-L-cysteine hydrolase